MNRLVIYVITLGALLLLILVGAGVLASIAYDLFKESAAGFLTDSRRDLTG